ncbi:Glycerol-1-phosphate dehydrogenase [NAD(P)+] [bacterium HR34]|nr:Glycerol-1-phosphate dehydrogenase [NAD(P)+] [bacterium HR34]
MDKVVLAKTEKEFFNCLNKFSREGRAVFVLDNVLAGNDFFKDKVCCYSKENSIKEVNNIIKDLKNKKFAPQVVFGIGGGRVLDVAKFLAFKLDVDFISCPTALSQDGIYSGVCVLFDGKKRKTVKAKFPEKVLVDMSLIKKSPKKMTFCGIGEVLSKIVVLQDISLAKSRVKAKVNKNKIKKILSTISYLIENFKSQKDENSVKTLLFALVEIGSLMQEDSYYASQSEHEFEKALFGTNLPHGQLVAFGALISAKLYEVHSEKFSKDKLFISPKDMFKITKSLFKIIKGFYNFAKEPLKIIDRQELIKCLKKASLQRPERFNLLNVIDSKKVNWEKVIEKL